MQLIELVPFDRLIPHGLAKSCEIMHEGFYSILQLFILPGFKTLLALHLKTLSQLSAFYARQRIGGSDICWL